MNSILKGKCYQLVEPFKLQLKEEIIEANSIENNELIAETLFSAVSPGTEVAAFSGIPPLRPGNAYPRLVGYCNVARVLVTGNSVKNYKRNDYILTFQAHRSLFLCKEEDVVLTLPQEADLVKASTTYLFHLGYNALLSADVKPGFLAGIIGAGTLGVTSCLMAQLSGCSTVVFTNQPHLNDFFKKMGVAMHSKSTVSKDDYNGHPVNTMDIVINTSNSWADWLLSLKLVRKGGTIVNIGFPGRGQPLPGFNPLDSQYIYDKQVTIKATGYTPDYDLPAHDVRFTIKRNMSFLYGIIEQNRIDPDIIISEVSPYSDLEKIYKRILARKDTYFTAVLKW